MSWYDPAWLRIYAAAVVATVVERPVVCVILVASGAFFGWSVAKTSRR